MLSVSAEGTSGGEAGLGGTRTSDELVLLKAVTMLYSRRGGGDIHPRV